MTSRVFLYSIPDLLEENNFVVEDMPAYLAHFSNAEEIEGFQWQRLEMFKTIKIAYSQNYNTPNPSESWNYAAIYAEDDEGNIDSAIAPAFYFIQRIEQRAMNTISLTMKLDCLNTFYDKWKGEMTPETYIARAHKDRFFVANQTTLNATLVDIYDKTPEGDSFPMVADKDSRQTIYDSAGGDFQTNPLKFYLIFRTSNNGRPCLDLCANRELLIDAGSQGGDPVDYDPNNTIEGRNYYLIGDFTIQYLIPPSTWTTLTGGILKFWRYSGTRMAFTYADASGDDVLSADPSIIRITSGRKVYYSAVDTFDARTIETFSYATINAGNYQEKYLGDISQLDKTDSRIVKVIECPYSPIEYVFEYVAGVYQFNRDIFSYESENENPPYLRTYDLGAALPERIIQRITQTKFRNTEAKASILALKSSPVAKWLVDPKLKTSPYEAETLIYDSFAIQIRLEDYAAPIRNTYTETGFAFYFKQSANVSSALYFRIEALPSTTGALDFMKFQQSEENFPSVLVASRNNEVALFSSEYLNYLKNGYNYEKKKQEENLGFQATMGVLQTLGSILSFALSPATGGGSATAGVGLAVGAATTFANFGMTAHQNAESLNQKINLLKSQSYSVSGIDDLDLFNGYAGNKAKRLTYKIREADRNRVAARFQYFGYAVDTYGDPFALGLLDSRYNFNYLKCDPVFRVSDISIVPEFLDDVAERLRAGITIFHRRFYDIQEGDDWWLNRDTENIETSIIAAIEGE